MTSKVDGLPAKIRDNIKDKYWRMNNLYRVVNKQGKDVPFKFNYCQQRIWDESFEKDNKDRWRIKNWPDILKGRQAGVTTFWALIYFDDCIFTRNLRAVILAHKKDALEIIFTTIRNAYRFLPDSIKPKVRGQGSKYKYHFEGLESSIEVTLEFRSGSIHKLHISERAFMDGAKIIASLGAVPADMRYSQETTPNGRNHYYEGYKDPKTNKNKIFIGWYDVLEYQIHDINTGPYTPDEITYMDDLKERYGKELTRPQIEFRRFKTGEVKGDKSGMSGEDFFNQEYASDEDSCFLSSGRPFFQPPLTFDKLQKKHMREPKKITDDGWEIFIGYIPGHTYLIVADTAEGLPHGDFCDASIIDLNLREEVACFRKKIDPDDFGEALVAGGKLYSLNRYQMPWLGIELNNTGHAVILACKYHGYPLNKFYYHSPGKAGWNTDKVSRNVGLSALREAMKKETIIFHSKYLYSEVWDFVYDDNGKPQASEGKHDDAVMSRHVMAGILVDATFNPSLTIKIDSIEKEPLSVSVIS